MHLYMEKKESRMSQIAHIEHHFTGSEFVRDIVMMVPFALAAGPSGIANSTAIVITGGLAEISASSIAMGLGVSPRPRLLAWLG